MTAQSRSMMPREHGAYAQLGLPLVAALAASRPTSSSVCYAFAACAAFVAHEPALILFGHRGSRARRDSGARARRWLAASLFAAAAAGAIAFAWSPTSRPWAALSAALGAAATALAFRRQERSLFGEALASSALASAAMPAAIAGGLPWQNAVGIWGVFGASFLVSTVEVRSVAHRPPSRAARIATWGAAFAILAGVAAMRPLLALASLPILAVVAYLVVRAPSAAALRRLGWTLASSSVLTAAVVVAVLRAPHQASSSTLGETNPSGYTNK